MTEAIWHCVGEFVCLCDAALRRLLGPALRHLDRWTATARATAFIALLFGNITATSLVMAAGEPVAGRAIGVALLLPLAVVMTSAIRRVAPPRSQVFDEEARYHGRHAAHSRPQRQTIQLTGW